MKSIWPTDSELSRFLLLLLLAIIMDLNEASKCSNVDPELLQEPEARAFIADTVVEAVAWNRSRIAPDATYHATFRIIRVVKGGDTLLIPKTLKFKFRHPAWKKSNFSSSTFHRQSKCLFDFHAALRRPYFLFLEKPRKSRRIKLAALPEPSNRKVQKRISKILCKGCAQAPKIHGLPKTIVISSSDKLRLTCRISGLPTPVVSWYKDGRLMTDGQEIAEKQIKDNKDSRIRIRSKKRRRSRLVVKNLSPSDSGDYECRATSLVGPPAVSRSRVQIVSPTTSTFSPVTPLSHRIPDRPSDEESCHLQYSFCLNGGTCHVYPMLGEYLCHCSEGYIGPRCELKHAPLSKTEATIRVNECSSTNAKLNPGCERPPVEDKDNGRTSGPANRKAYKRFMRHFRSWKRQRLRRMSM
ncbi:unnamed protein product [Cyprideis torosa]|uniref:Uncharacterized protein n=1 Tax=Cyprideis torosa TaxID=163714 RepID=A0A7R8ZIQ2_9CRUS|nr:unnamed protein product [Cyprideis torosa]CAG0886695.1 unnamed protein product [Cyprideis torosa]